MKSPLPVLWDFADKQGFAPAPLKDDLHSFDFYTLFPFETGHRLKNCILVHCDIEWASHESGVIVTLSLADLNLSVLKNPQTFLDDLERETMTFMVSMVEFDDNDEEGSLPDGVFYLREAGKSLLTPVFSTVIEYEDDADMQVLPDRLALHLQYSSHVLWLVQPVFAFIKQERREPTAHERMRELFIAHGRLQILRPEARVSKDDPPPKIFFPDGLFGGKIAGLRPQ